MTTSGYHPLFSILVSLLLLLGLYESVVIRRGRNTLTTVCFDKLKADIIINLFGRVLRTVTRSQ